MALLDAAKAAELPTVEVRISHPHTREEFRRHSCTSLAAKAVIAGAGISGYGFAVNILTNHHNEGH